MTKTFHRVDMDFMKSIAIVVTRTFALAVTDAFMPVAPLFKSKRA